MSETEKQSLSPDAIKAAVDWWASLLNRLHDQDKNAKFGGGQEGSMLNLMTALLHTPKSEEQLETFKAHLAAGIEAEFSRGWGNLTLRVDYAPEGILGYAAHAAGIKDGFPFKTQMTITADKVRARKGYGGEEELLWQKPE